VWIDYNGTALGPQNALDGKQYDKNGYTGVCSATNLEVKPWWFVFLEGKKKINQVIMYNDPTVASRSNNAKVYVGDSSDYTKNTLCPGQVTQNNAEKVTVNCNLSGRFVNIAVDKGDIKTSLNLCEVQVVF